MNNNSTEDTKGGYFRVFCPLTTTKVLGFLPKLKVNGLFYKSDKS